MSEEANVLPPQTVPESYPPLLTSYHCQSNLTTPGPNLGGCLKPCSPFKAHRSAFSCSFRTWRIHCIPLSGSYVSQHFSQMLLECRAGLCIPTQFGPGSSSARAGRASPSSSLPGKSLSYLLSPVILSRVFCLVIVQQE